MSVKKSFKSLFLHTGSILAICTVSYCSLLDTLHCALSCTRRGFARQGCFFGRWTWERLFVQHICNGWHLPRLPRVRQRRCDTRRRPREPCRRPGNHSTGAQVERHREARQRNWGGRLAESMACSRPKEPSELMLLWMSQQCERHAGCIHKTLFWTWLHSTCTAGIPKSSVKCE